MTFSASMGFEKVVDVRYSKGKMRFVVSHPGREVSIPCPCMRLIAYPGSPKIVEL
jgi:hypothetical protein